MRNRFRALVKPSLADFLYVALLGWLVAFSVSGTGAGLLQDSGTGYHIRVGDYILDHGAVPSRDPFSFTRPGQPWFAWEWLASLMLAGAYRAMALKGVILVAAVIIALAMLILLWHTAWRGANALVAIFLLHLAIGAASIHFLARPHIITLLFFAASMWLLDADQRRPSRAVWGLAPLTVLWVNLHGGFVALLVSLAILAVGYALERNWAAARRYALVALACTGASLVNPYGVREHVHLFEYLRAGWIASIVEEFQSPRFQLSETRYFELLLFLGILAAAALLVRKNYARALLVLAWAHAALVSVRHVPLFAIVAVPLLAEELTTLWDRWASSKNRGSIVGVLDKLARDYRPQLSRLSLWSPLATLLLLCAPLGIQWPSDFPSPRYPVEMASRHAGLLAGSRLFTTDAWADYLNFRFYPRQRVFIDGRSDFFGEALSNEYQDLLYGRRGWDDLLRRFDIRVVLVPSSSSLASLLRESPLWRRIDDNDSAALFVRGSSP